MKATSGYFEHLIPFCPFFRQACRAPWHFVQLQYHSKRAEDILCHFEGNKWQMGKLRF